MIDLQAEAEYFARGAAKFAGRLHSHGISAATIAYLGERTPIGIGPIEVLPDLLYQPSDDGKPHVILPVWEGNGIIDSIAFDPREPDRWYRRIGQAAFLGGDQLFLPTYDAPTTEIWATPLDWLRAGGFGSVILDFDDPDLVRQLSICETIVTDRLTARMIRLEFARPRPVPRIINRRAARHVA